VLQKKEQQQPNTTEQQIKRHPANLKNVKTALHKKVDL
jgi:hypothetical protein